MTAQRMPDLPATMPAWRNEEYGSAAGVRFETVPVPQPKRGEVLLRIRATALNAGDVRVMLGDPLLVRPFFGLTRPKNPIRGMDVAGTVVALGDDVNDVALGDEVVVELPGGGGLAAYACAPVARLAARPEGVSPQHAACVPIAGGTAWQALDLAGLGTTDAARPRRVLIVGASGGVGTFAVQLAAQRGAEVWASCGERNHSLVQELGAARTFDHRRRPLAELPAGHFDAVIDIAGVTPLPRLQRLLAAGGTAALVGGEGGRVLGPVPRMLRAALLSVGSRRRIRPLAAKPLPDVVRGLLGLVADGRIAPVIEREYPFAEASAALAHLEAGHVVGKLVVHAA